MTQLGFEPDTPGLHVQRTIATSPSSLGLRFEIFSTQQKHGPVILTYITGPVTHL